MTLNDLLSGKAIGAAWRWENLLVVIHWEIDNFHVSKCDMIVVFLLHEKLLAKTEMSMVRWWMVALKNFVGFFFPSCALRSWRKLKTDKYDYNLKKIWKATEENTKYLLYWFKFFLKVKQCINNYRIIRENCSKK